MRNRVALKAARTRAAVTSKLVRMSVTAALVPALVAAVLVAVARTASADERVAAESASVGLAGPVGIAAVVLGFGGLIIGLLRHRRRDASTTVLPVVQPPVEPRAGERAL